jgi:hypothetical protein
MRIARMTLQGSRAAANSEIRNAKFETNQKYQGRMPKRGQGARRLRVSAIGASFVFRVSEFGFCTQA